MELSSEAASSLTGAVRVPGDKSITHRALLLSALAEGESVVAGVNTGADCQALEQALQKLGSQITRTGSWRPQDILSEKTRPGYRIIGAGATWRQLDERLNLGNSGTAFRLLAGVLAGQPIRSILDGDESLRRRPMKRITEPLRQMGARISGLEGEDRAPLEISGGDLVGVRMTPSVPSAQVKSAVLLAGLAAEGETWVRESIVTRDHTERLLPQYGCEVMIEFPKGGEGATVGVRGGGRLTPATVEVAGDFSAAAFWLVAATVVPGSDVRIEGIGLNTHRTGLLTVLERMGANIEMVETELLGGEPVGTLRVRSAPLRACSIDPRELPSMIDEIPIWAIAAAAAAGESEVSGASELRAKESDRLGGLALGLQGIGVEAEESPGGLTIRGRDLGGGASLWTGGRVDSQGDHRLAMAFLVAGLRSLKGVQVTGCEMVDTSYPGFYSQMMTLVSAR